MNPYFQNWKHDKPNKRDTNYEANNWWHLLQKLWWLYQQSLITYKNHGAYYLLPRKHKAIYFKAAYIILRVPNHLVEEYRIRKKDEET